MSDYSKDPKGACSSYMRKSYTLEEHQSVLASLYNDLLGIFPIDALLWYLYSKHIITDGQCREILAEKTAEKQCTIFLQRMIQQCTRNVEVLEAFHDGVQEQYPWIATKIAQKIEMKRFDQEMEKNDGVQRLIGLLTRKLRCDDEEEKLSDGHLNADADQEYHEASCSRSHSAGRMSTRDEHTRTHTGTTMKRILIDDETNSIKSKRQKVEISTDITGQKKGGKKPSLPSKVYKMVKNKLRGVSTKSTSEPAVPQEERAHMRLGADIEMAKAVLREALRKYDADTLRATLENCVANELLQGDHEVLEALDTLQSIDKIIDNLKSARLNKDVNGIRFLIESVSQCKEAKFLTKELEGAKQLCLELDASRCRSAPMGNTTFDVKKAIDEIKRSRSPSPLVEQVMRAFFMVIGVPEDQLSDWKTMQKTIQKQSTGLYQRIATFKPGKSFSLVANKVRTLVKLDDQDVQTTSAALYPFYAWVKRQLGEKH